MLFSESQYTDEHRYLLSKEFRAELAERVNMELLASRGEKRQGSRLEEMVKTRVWAEKKAREKAREKGMDLPGRVDVGLEGLVGRLRQEEGRRGDGAGGEGGDDGNDGDNNEGNNGQAQDDDAMET